MTSKHKMAADSVDTFVQRLLREMAIRYVNVYYCSKGKGEAYILNYKTNARDFVSIVNLSLVSSGGTIAHRHITLTSLLALLSNSSLL